MAKTLTLRCRSCGNIQWWSDYEPAPDGCAACGAAIEVIAEYDEGNDPRRQRPNRPGEQRPL